MPAREGRIAKSPESPTVSAVMDRMRAAPPVAITDADEGLLDGVVDEMAEAIAAADPDLEEARAAERDAADAKVRFDCPRHPFIKIRIKGTKRLIRFSYGRFMTNDPLELVTLRSKKYRSRYHIHEEDGSGRLHESADGTFWYSDEARLAYDKGKTEYAPSRGYIAMD